jgi:hypothetical protein
MVVAKIRLDEGRKRVLLIAASILAARKLSDCDGRPSPAVDACIANAITMAERINLNHSVQELCAQTPTGTPRSLQQLPQKNPTRRPPQPR